MLEIKKITKVYRTEGFKQKALDGVSVNFRECEFASILGPSGSGKTTILKMLCHKLPNDSVYYNDLSISDHNINSIKQNIVVVFDEPLKKSSIESELIQYLGVCDLTQLEKEEKVRQMIDIFGLNELKGKNINTLSLNDKNLVKILKYLIIEQFTSIND